MTLVAVKTIERIILRQETPRRRPQRFYFHMVSPSLVDDAHEYRRGLFWCCDSDYLSWVV